MSVLGCDFRSRARCDSHDVTQWEGGLNKVTSSKGRVESNENILF